MMLGSPASAPALAKTRDRPSADSPTSTIVEARASTNASVMDTTPDGVTRESCGATTGTLPVYPPGVGQIGSIDAYWCSIATPPPGDGTRRHATSGAKVCGMKTAV